MGATVTDLKRELDVSVDTKISAEQLRKIREDLRNQYVIEFHGLKEAMEVSVAMGDDDRAKLQREAAERVIKAITVIDQRMQAASEA
jgi:alanyl-tRNA synthetase